MKSPDNRHNEIEERERRLREREDAVKECFDVYEREVNQRINDDILSRKSELDNLVQQKETREINRDNELNRLKNLQ